MTPEQIDTASTLAVRISATLENGDRLESYAVGPARPSDIRTARLMVPRDGTIHSNLALITVTGAVLATTEVQ